MPTSEERKPMSEEPKAEKPNGRGKLLLLAGVPLLLCGLGEGLWFGGLLPKMLGHGKEHPPAETTASSGAPTAPRPPVFLDMPEIVANLNVPGLRSRYIKLRSKIELVRPEDAAALQAAMPRLQDLYTTYLREMRPEEFRGSAGTQRLREELIARANLAAAPARVTDVLFVELLLQ